MKAAGLKPIDTVVSSTAVLIKSKNPTNVDTVELVAARIRGVISKLSVLHPKHFTDSLKLHKNTSYANTTSSEQNLQQRRKSLQENEHRR
jgi:ATP phosphoribosyltransferase